jgi:hypothetical protein
VMSVGPLQSLLKLGASSAMPRAVRIARHSARAGGERGDLIGQLPAAGSELRNLRGRIVRRE